MAFASWLQNLRSALASGPGQRHHRRRDSLRAGMRRTKLEPLEDRSLLSFSPVASFPVGTDPRAVVAADFNNDGNLDLATANHGGDTYDFDGSFSVLLGDGQGDFAAAKNVGAGANLLSMAVGDLNNDGNLDLAAVDDYAWGTNSVWLGDGAGGFVWTEGGTSRYTPQSVAVADLNADGSLDLVNVSVNMESFGETYIEVQLGDGRGGFTTAYVEYIGGGQALAVADLNADGTPDVIAASEGSMRVSVLLGNGDGTLRYTSNFATDNNTRAVAVGDFTSDGIPDLLAGGYTRVAVLPGNGDGTFGPPISQQTSNAQQIAVAVADFDSDGMLDVVAADEAEGTVTALLGLGNGTFTLVDEHAAGSSTRAVAVGDFNGDGRPDVGAANTGSNTVAVLLNDAAWPDENTPRVQVRDVTVTEGNTGTRTATFTVTLSAASGRPVTVAYATGNGTAVSGSDYQAVSGTLTFALGETTKTITVLVNGDRVGEPNEAFVVNLSNPTNATIADAQGVGTIVDDEPRVSVSDVTKTEGIRGKTSFTFTVTLSAAYDQAVTVSFRTVSGTATTGDNDYTAKTGTLTFAPGETIKTITVEVRGDSKREADETFYVDLFGLSSNALFTKKRGTGTILNDD